jgi:hypothetical protein
VLRRADPPPRLRRPNPQRNPLPPGARLPRHCHEHAYFCLIRRGTYREEYGGRQRSRGPLLLAFHPPGEVHAEHFGGEPVRSFNLEITPSWLRGAASWSVGDVRLLTPPARAGS